MNTYLSDELVVYAEQNQQYKAFWLEQLQNIQGGRFPVDVVENATTEGPSHRNFRTTELQLTWEQSSQILKLCKGANKKLHAFFSTVVAIWIYKHQKQDRFAICSPIYRQENEGTFINNLLPIICQIDNTQSFKEILLSTTRTISGSLAYQNYPILYLLDKIHGSDKNQPSIPIYDIMLVVEGLQAYQYVEFLPSNIRITVQNNKGHLQLLLSYNEALYQESTVAKLVRDFHHIVDLGLDDIHIQLDDISIDSYKFSSFIIGNSSLATKCAEKLIRKGHSLKGIISNDPEVGAWCEKNEVTSYQFSSEDDVCHILTQDRPDYFFSINNPLILSASTIEVPSKWTINYHDSLLPAFAGMYSTTWTLVDGQQQHGVTWHLVEDKIDTGDILEQATIPISKSETASSLNLKCYNNALQTFERLIDKIGLGQITRVKQNTALRSYNGLYKRPFAAGIINFNQSAEKIERTVRAFDFGSYNNPLSTIKFGLEDLLCVPQLAKILPTQSVSEPGTILAWDDAYLTVSTTSQDIQFSKVNVLSSRANKSIQTTLYKGLKLDFPEEQLAEIEKINRRICKHEAYWVGKLKEFPPLNIPVSGDDSDEQSKGEIQKLSIPLPEQATSLVDNSANPSNSLGLIWLSFIYRISGVSKFWIQYRHKELDDLLPSDNPVFSDFIPLEVDADPNMTVEDFISHHEDLIERTKNSLTFQKDIFLRYHELASLSTNYSNVKITEGNGSLGALHADHKTPFHFVIDKNIPQICMYYPPNSVGDTLVAQLKNQFIHFLNNYLRNPSLPIMKISILSKAESKQLLTTFNATEHEYGIEKTLNQLFEEVAPIYENRVAIFHEDRHITYGELHQRANSYAKTLREKGVKKGDLVAVLTQRSPEMIIGMLAILKVGGIYAPVDPKQPLNRISQILRSINVKYVLIYNIGFEWLESLYRDSSTITYFFDLEGSTLSLDSGSLPNLPIVPLTLNDSANITTSENANNLAYIIHTSGSTGIPKGVAVKHHAAVNILEWINRTYNIGPEDKLLFVTSIGFDLSVYDIFGILGVGASIQIVSEKFIRNPKQLSDLITTYAITIWDSTPGTLQQLIPYLSKTADQKNEFRLAMLSGDWIPLTLPSNLKRLFPNIHVLSMGGATEATIWSNFFNVGKVDPKWKSIPYGKPIQNCEYFILDESLNLCPMETEGDLYIGGVCLSEGYINNPSLTHDRFIDNPFLPGKKMYKTGDRARWFSDGNIEFLGRKDHQIKLRGFRIELGEIESHILKFPGVEHAMALVKTFSKDDKRLIAFVVARLKISTEELKSYLKEYLPHYMIPFRITQVDQIPITPIGKIDRKALLNMEVESASDAPPVLEENKLPAPEIAQRIVDIWKEVLGLKYITLDDNFFEIGGHSFLVLQISNKMEEEFGTEPSFVHFTNKSLGEFIECYMLEAGLTLTV